MRIYAIPALALGLGLSAAFAHPAPAPAHTGAQFMANAPQQITLTSKQIEACINSYGELRTLGNKYDAEWGKDSDWSGGKGDPVTLITQQLQAHGALGEFTAVLNKYGFKNIQDWWQTIYSVMMAAAFSDPQSSFAHMNADLEKSKAEVNANPNLTPEQKAQIAAQMQGARASYAAMQPPAGNLQAIAPYAAKIKTMMKDEHGD